MNKEVLRKVYLEKRKTLTLETRASRSEIICHRAIEFLKQGDRQNIHLFLPIDSQGEINTWPILDFINGSQDLQAIVSKTDFKAKSLTHFAVDKHTRFENDKYNIPTPSNAEKCSLEIIDLVFVPLISFDLVGNRIGYGGGYYDRFLKSCNSATQFVGLSMTPPLDKILCTEDHDIRLDQCICHIDFYKFK